MTTYKLPNKDISVTDDELDQLIEQREKGSGVWKPENRERYYYVTSLLKVVVTDWCETPADIYHWNSGNPFNTREAAKAYRDYLKAKAKVARAIREANDGWMPEWEEGYSHQLEYNHRRGAWGLWRSKIYDVSFLPYAKSEEILKNIRNEQAGELETIANYRRHHNV
jgi:hypothetical protein